MYVTDPKRPVVIVFRAYTYHQQGVNIVYQSPPSDNPRLDVYDPAMSTDITMAKAEFGYERWTNECI